MCKARLTGYTQDQNLFWTENVLSLPWQNIARELHTEMHKQSRAHAHVAGAFVEWVTKYLLPA